MILDDIGLTAKEQSEVTISGSLMENKESAINFQVKGKDIIKDVKWDTIDMSLPKDGKIRDSIVFKGILFTIIRSSHTGVKEGIYKSEDGINFTCVKEGRFCNFSYNVSQDKLYISDSDEGILIIDKDMHLTEWKKNQVFFVISYGDYIYCIIHYVSGYKVAFSISGDPDTLKETTYSFYGGIDQSELAIFDNKIFVTNRNWDLEWAPLAKNPNDSFDHKIISTALSYRQLKIANNKLFISTANNSLYQIITGDNPNVNQIPGSAPTSSNDVEDFCSDDNNYMYTCGLKESGSAPAYVYYSKDGLTNYASLDDFSEYRNINSIFSFKNLIIFDAWGPGSSQMETFLWNKYPLD